MGLAATQARMLLLVARKSDLEYRSQCLTQRKMVLSQQTEQLAKDYSKKISNRSLRFVYNLDGNSSDVRTEDFTYYSMTAENAKFVGQYRLLDNRGNIVVPSINDIPKNHKKIDVYTAVKRDGSTITPLLREKVVYNQTKESLGNTTDPSILFIQGLDENGQQQYIQIQNADGSKVENAVIYSNLNGELMKNNVFVKNEDGEFTLNPALQSVPFYTKSITQEYVTTTNPDEAAALEEGYAFEKSGTQTVEVPPTMGPDGYYTSDDGKRYIVCADVANKNYFQNGLRTGAFTIQQANFTETKDELGNVVDTYTSWETKPWQGIDIIEDILNTEDDAQAQSDYEAKTAVIKAQDQMLDLEIKQIETQHKAIEAEEDSLKKIRDGNIDKTFKIFA